MRTPIKIALIVGLVLAIVAVTSFVGLVRRGFSAHDEPSAIEAAVARAVRKWAVPADLRGAGNPVEAAPEVLEEARAHWADHCATCHGNDGKGRTMLGSRTYPHAPDMTRPETQAMRDGEIFAIIENGIRLTAMPGWGEGTAESAYASWSLVHFVRKLPDLTAEDLSAMEAINPKSPEEWEEMRAERASPDGEPASDEGDAGAQASPHGH